MRRVLVVGNCGAGKSTFARALGAHAGLPVVHLDKLWWRPGWQEVGADAFDAALGNELARDAWIIEGNFTRTLATRLERADTAIWLDLSRHLCIARILRRVLASRGRDRLDMPDGCPDRLDLAFLRWTWAYPTRSRAKTAELLDAFERAGRRVVRLRSPREVRAWQDRFGSPQARETTDAPMA